MSGLIVTLQQGKGGISAFLSRPAPLPIEALLLGQPIAEARSMIGCLFGLCRKAHLAAFDLALGLGTPDPSELSQEIRINHLALLFLHAPPLLGMASCAPPRADLNAALLGQASALFTAGDMWGWLGSNSGLAPLCARIAKAFAPGEADPGPNVTLPATRVANRPILERAASSFGHGPLWQALGLIADLLALETPGHLIAMRVAPGQALASSARGNCLIGAQARNDLLTHFQRSIPTDDLIAPDGALLRALTCLRVKNLHLAPLVVALLNPCQQVIVEERVDA